MKEEIYQTIDRLYKQRNLKTLLSKLVSWFLTEELQITDFLLHWKDGYLPPIPPLLVTKIGSLFSHGTHGMKKNEHVAFLFFKCSADFGDAFACGKCAQFYFDGRAPEGKQLLLAEFYCRRALVANSERFKLLMANIFFLKGELRNALVCTRDILSTVCTYDQIHYCKGQRWRGELILQARQLEKDCLMQMFQQSVNDSGEMTASFSVSSKAIKCDALQSSFIKASQLCNLYLVDRVSPKIVKEDIPSESLQASKQFTLQSSLSQESKDGYLSLPGWTRINENLDGFDASTISPSIQGYSLLEAQQAAPTTICIPITNVSGNDKLSEEMISLHRTRYISVQEHTIRRQLLAEKAFFEFSGCKHVKQLATSLMKSRLRDDDPRKQHDSENREIAVIRWPAQPRSPAGSVLSGRSILAAERLALETSFKAFFDLGSDCRVFCPEDGVQSLVQAEDSNTLGLIKDFQSDEDADVKGPHHKKLKQRQAGALFAGWSWQENIEFFTDKSKKGVIMARTNSSTDNEMTAGHSPTSKSPRIRSSRRPPFHCGLPKTSMPSLSQSSQSKSFLEVNKSVEASEILPQIPVLLPANLAHRLAVDRHSDPEFLPSLMLSYPEEVYVGNASLEYRHSVNINFRSSESNYLPTTLLDDPHEVVASINKITMSAGDGTFSESESQLASLIIRFVHTGQPLNFYDVRDQVNSRIHDDQIAFLNAIGFHFFIKRLSSWILPFKFKLSNRNNFPLNKSGEPCIAVEANDLLEEDSSVEVPLASAQARALRLISEGYLSFAELFLPSSEYSIMHICYSGGGAEYSCCSRCHPASDKKFDDLAAIRLLREKVIKLNDLYHQSLLLHSLSNSNQARQTTRSSARMEKDEFAFVHYWKKHPQGQCLATLHASLLELYRTFGSFSPICSSSDHSDEVQPRMAEVVRTEKSGNDYSEKTSNVIASTAQRSLEVAEDSYLRRRYSDLFQ